MGNNLPPGVLTNDDLKALTGYERTADVRRCLDGQNIRYFFGRNCIWTTIGLVEAAAGLVPGSMEPQTLSPDAFL